MIPTVEYSSLIQKMREFFLEKKYYEVAVQSRVSILAACEDPFTVQSFEWDNQLWPLPQTGQMWLEHELLKNPRYPGVFCISTSYRNEPSPIAGRHEKIFPMFEFESHGDVADLLQLEKDLLSFFNFNDSKIISYKEACQKFSTHLLEHEHEQMLCSDASAVFITCFLAHTDPFWNMKYIGEGIFQKIDVILAGQETIGSAERSTDVEEMRHNFHTVSGEKYRDELYSLFGETRVNQELDHYLSLDFFPRFGGGIGITRFLSALQQQNSL
ncbi:MAG: amino acid--tRNA ligase-related protein [Chlamydiales bacterium]